jgi:hypothetical protein
MCAMEDAHATDVVAAPSRPRVTAARLALGAAAGAATGVATLASISGTLPTLGPDAPTAWAGVAGLGAVAGALLAARAPAPVAGATVPAGESHRVSDSAPEIPTALLHLVSGATRRATEAAVTELAARFLAVGERVLVIDGARHLQVHEWFGVDERLGLVECLEGRLPLLGMVQSSGHPGLYLLAHGAPTTEERWPRLGRLFDEAWPHFGRILLVLDPGATETVGDALRGRLLRAWWSGTEAALPKSARALSQRVGIWFGRIDLGLHADLTLEGLGERVRTLRELLPVAVEDAEDLVLPAPVVPAPVRPREAEVLACNLQVRERLRFLIWMRRVQAESQREVLSPA